MVAGSAFIKAEVAIVQIVTAYWLLLLIQVAIIIVAVVVVLLLEKVGSWKRRTSKKME